MLGCPRGDCRVQLSVISGCYRSTGYWRMVLDKVEHNLAKVGVEGSNPFARSN
jgi:hypothetical protein